MAKIGFTAPRLAAFACPPDKEQAFLWDVDTPGLGLRNTPAGKAAFIFQGLYQGKTLRLTIGNPDAWSIPQARQKARELQRAIDEGLDPRNLKREALAQATAQAEAERATTVTVGEAWGQYLNDRRPYWGELHARDHERLSKAGGTTAVRGTRGRGMTVAGPLHPLMALPLRDLNAPTIEAWAAREAQTRPTPARLAHRLLKAFLNWCSEHPHHAALLPTGNNPAKTRRTREVLGKAGVKQDALLREQLPAWFAAVGGLHNPVIAAYLQILLLTGARPGELLALRWEDVNWQWHGLTLGDKIEENRIIPLTPYVSHLLSGLPRRSVWVFSSPTHDRPASKPHHAHSNACTVAGLDGLTLHGLRRSFKSLTEWLEVPVGIVAQIMGHKPSATAEKHYTVRPLDLLRLHHEKIEAWMLEQAGVTFQPQAVPGGLRVVARMTRNL